MPQMDCDLHLLINLYTEKCHFNEEIDKKIKACLDSLNDKDTCRIMHEKTIREMLKKEGEKQ